MVGRIVYGVCAVALVAATAVFAQPSASTTAKSDANKQICRIVSDTGSRLGRSRKSESACLSPARLRWPPRWRYAGDG